MASPPAHPGAAPPTPPVLDQWSNHARQWALIGSPLRPVAEDLRVAVDLLREWQSEHPGRAPRVLLLGVTPELASLPWPAGTALVAVDRSEPMIAAVFPHDRVPPGTRVLCADWAALPLPDASIDIVVGDGCFSVLPFPETLRAVAHELRRVMTPAASLLMRVFAAPPEREPLATVARDLQSGEISTFHCLKWRLAMALQPASAAGVRLADIHAAFLDLRPLLVARAAHPGFEPETVGTIESYRGSPTVYWFPLLTDLHAALADLFTISPPIAKSYQLGERCPTLLLRPR